MNTSNEPLEIFDLSVKRCQDYVLRYKNKKSFVRNFRKKYRFIRVYHATNLGDGEVKAIENNGMLRTTKQLLKEKAISRFIRPDDNDETKAKILRGIELALEEDFITIGEINFGHNKGSLIEKTYHYLRFGCETLLPLATEMKHRLDIVFRKRMAEFGNSYIISANIPVDKTDDDWIELILEYMNKGAFECCLVYYHDLEAENIVAIEKQEMPYDYRGYDYM